MKRDSKWRAFLSDASRYADFINGIGCGGAQILRPADLKDADTRGGQMSRDLLRRAALGMNFILLGIENQEEADYRMPLRTMLYDAHDYEKQLSEIRRRRRSGQEEYGESGEYLYGFGRDDRLHPVITFVLYSGEKPWDGPGCLHDMLNFTDVPEALRRLTPDYPLHVVELRRFTRTDVFRTDVKQVFDFIRLSKDKAALLELIQHDEGFRHMDEDAFALIASYTTSARLLEMVGQNHTTEGEKKNMSDAIQELIEDGRAEGLADGLRLGRDEGLADGRREERQKLLLRFLTNGGTEEDAIRLLDVTKEEIEAARNAG